MVSIVVSARNDDYGVNFLGRFQNFINVVLPLLQAHAPHCELIVVEWNPPQDRPCLAQAVSWPSEIDAVRTRIIKVSPEIHATLPGFERMPFFEFIAKNVGLRRASRDYVLVTNPDVFFSPSLAALLGSNAFSKQLFYRIDRYDTHVPSDLPKDPLQALQLAHEGIFQAHIFNNSILIDDKVRAQALITGEWPHSAAQFANVHRPRLLMPFDTIPGKYWGLHTNGSGDFILTHRQNWDLIRGFPEYHDACSHLDSYACYQLKAAGIKQTLINPPCRLLHQDHSRIETKERPRLEKNIWMNDLKKIQEGRLGPAINAKDWGLADLELHETFIG